MDESTDTTLEWRTAGRRTSAGVEVSVETAFVPERSNAYRSTWFYAYRISLRNAGDRPVQLLDRRWEITDAIGRGEVVEGSGVIGQQPRLGCGDRFSYVSFCPLPTPHGSMRGHYGFVDDDGNRFLVEIPPFALVQPGDLH